MIPHANDRHAVSELMRAIDAMASRWERNQPSAANPTALRHCGFASADDVRRALGRIERREIAQKRCGPKATLTPSSPSHALALAERARACNNVVGRRVARWLEEVAECLERRDEAPNLGEWCDRHGFSEVHAYIVYKRVRQAAQAATPVVVADAQESYTPRTLGDCDAVEAGIPTYVADTRRMQGLREYLDYCRAEIEGGREPVKLRRWCDAGEYAHTSVYRAMREARGVVGIGGGR